MSPGNIFQCYVVTKKGPKHPYQNLQLQDYNPTDAKIVFLPFYINFQSQISQQSAATYKQPSC